MQPHLPSSILSFFLFLVFHAPTSSCQDDFPLYTQCAPSSFSCGETIQEIRYPFLVPDRSPYCGFPAYYLSCEENTVTMNISSVLYNVNNINYQNNTLRVVRKDFMSETCPVNNTTMDNPYYNVSNQAQNLTLYYNCRQVHPLPAGCYPLPCFNASDLFAYFSFGAVPSVPAAQFIECQTSVMQILGSEEGRLEEEPNAFEEVVKEGFDLMWNIGVRWCRQCVDSGGRCGYNSTHPAEPTCYCRDGEHAASCPRSNHTERRKIKIIIGVCTGVGSCILTCLLFLFCFCYRKRRLGAASALLSRGMSSDPSSRSELGKEDLRLPTHVFSYEELEDATNNFDPSKELGDGGFGTVYHGRLQDGRSIAVKRLYENNYRRVEQFMNEIDILSRLRHPNLVTLYGCTSRHSRELLLVYEYIPNGTVADHLYGNRAKDGCLTWPIRMGIAIETADALSYLHAVDIIHRDVKTNNILLDSNFRVKVADFGLSRLFPMDKTHVSTAPQGTPGYVDPDYHRCYQLNDKSDVYSFGVVLIELISSKPAVDITRHRHEINLANMAINKIHNRALHEMVDPTLGFETDHAVMRMITLVSELAFRCLQDEKEVRPSMYEVLKFLKGIENEDYKVEKGAEMDVQAPDDAVLLNRKMPPTSPDSVTNVWTSRSTTPNASGSKCFPLVVV